MTSEPDNAHLIEALRYLSGEMDPGERTRFELLLSEGGPSCDALADMVVLQQAVTASQQMCSSSPVNRASETVCSPRTTGWMHAGGWKLVVTGCAALTLLVGLLVLQSLPKQPADLAWEDDAGSQDQQDQQQDQIISVAETWSLLSSTARESGSEMDGELDETEWNIAPVNVPEWMYAAVDASLMNEDEKTINEPLDESAL